MEMKSLYKNAKYYWLLQNIICLLVLCLPFTLARSFTEGTVKLAITISGGIILGVLTVFLAVFPFLKYRFFKYSIDSERIVIHKGVIFRHRIIIPVCQIQDLHIYRGPIMSAFNMSGVIFSTAGSNFSLPYVEKSQAEKTVLDVEEFLKARLKVLDNEEIL